MPESLLKKRKATDALRAKALAARKVEKTAAKAKRATIFKRAEAYVAEYAKEARSLIDARRAARRPQIQMTPGGHQISRGQRWIA